MAINPNDALFITPASAAIVNKPPVKTARDMITFNGFNDKMRRAMIGRKMAANRTLGSYGKYKKLSQKNELPIERGEASTSMKYRTDIITPQMEINQGSTLPQSRPELFIIGRNKKGINR
jgi:hypothetical protein